jgi:hypothetical protein
MMHEHQVVLLDLPLDGYTLPLTASNRGQALRHSTWQAYRNLRHYHSNTSAGALSTAVILRPAALDLT